MFMAHFFFLHGNKWEKLAWTQRGFQAIFCMRCYQNLFIDIENIPLVHWPHRNGSWGDVKLTSGKTL